MTMVTLAFQHFMAALSRLFAGKLRLVSNQDIFCYRPALDLRKVVGRFPAIGVAGKALSAI